MNTTEIIVVGSAGIYPDTVVIGASRAGGRGFLQAQTDLNDLLRRSETVHAAAPRFGIALSEWSDRHFIQELFAKLPEGLATILVPYLVWRADADVIAPIRQRGIEIFLEVDRREQFGSVEPGAIDGLILKGNESGGRVSGTTAYILTQQWCELCERDAALAGLPFWVRGGIGVRSAAAATLAGATGVVLDSQLLLTRESPLTRQQRQFVAALDGSESVSVGSQLGIEYRVCAKPGSPIIAELGDKEDELAAATMDQAKREAQWQAEVWQQFEAHTAAWPIFFAGPDAALAADLADQFVTVAGVMQGIVAGAKRLISQAATQQLLAAESPLAESHATRYAILQGPMTRVSDVPEFADAISAGGALPFLALALLREAQALEILQKTETLLGDRSWGVGLLGFLPPEIRKEQIRAIKQHKPPFAIIAGGRPDQAKELEDDGIVTYLHVPSPGLLSMFLRGGAKRFILEGRECGGHVGPRTSFLLWEQQISVLQKHLHRARDADQYHVVFAGGIHDGPSAAMAVTMAAELAELGVRVGVLMGTAYLFTKEAVETGAIVKKFQEEVRGADQTVLFETGPGHAVRCLRTPYYDDFVSEKVRLKQAGKQHTDIVAALERMNIGRLRVASKGVDRRAPEPGAPRQLVEVDATEQHDRGMYMVGQVASMHEEVTTIAALHERISTGAAATLRAAMPRVSVTESPPEPNPCDIAIVGMSCFYPEASSVQEYWDNILERVYTVTEVPNSHWDWRIYYDENPRAKDKIVSKWGGFLSDIPFDPLQYGITPKSIQAIEPLQLLVLEAVAHAVNDAGYRRRPFDRENTCAVLGIGGGGSAMAVNYGFRACLPLLDTVDEIDISPFDMIEACEEMLPDWTEDSFPGILMNVAVGRVANRFDLGGSNYALDAACASSLSAVHACIRELELGTANVAFAMGADTVQTPYAYVAFSKTHALSPQGRCRPFDASADGIVLSEGVGVVMLKRLADAERDGDKIYSVIRGIGSSSDGKDKGLTAPNAAGQMRALRRAYHKAGIPPSRVGLVEAHGTGTVVGDRTESAALAEVMRDSNAERQSCALGSVKSMIGHSKCAAGVAGLIKATMALHHKVLPPTLVEMPNPTANYSETALFLNTETRPWIDDRREPRCAGVSAFGFGGTNVHVVMEEYTGDNVSDEAAPIRRWPSELFVYREATLADLTKSIETAIGALDAGAKTEAANYAASLWRHAAPKSGPVIAIVAPSLQRLRGHLDLALAMVKKQPQSAGATAVDPRGIYFCAAPDQQDGKLAVLFPGQGSQYPNMLSDVAVNFPVVRQAMDEFATAPLVDDSMDGLERPLARYIYPPSTFTEEEAQLTSQALASTDVAQPAIGAASMGMFRLTQQLAITPDVMAGHSYGEYTALWAAGAIDQRDFMRLSYRRGRLLREAAGDQTGGMAAVTADGETVLRLLEGLSGVTLANLNAPDQTVISGRNQALQKAIERLKAKQIKVQPLHVSCAFHSPQVALAQSQFAAALEKVSFDAPQVTVLANESAAAYPDDPQAIRETLCSHIISPVQFRAQIEAMYAAGVRTFVEVGPHNHLTGLVKRNLGDRPHVAVSTDVSSRHGLTQLQHCLAQLLTANIPLNLDVLFDGRVTETFAPAALRGKAGEVEYSPMTHMVNGIRSRQWQAPEPRLLGQRMEGTAAVATEDIQLADKSNVTPPAPAPAAAAPNAMAKPSSLKTTTMSNESMKPSAVARQLAPDDNGQPTNGQLTDGVPLQGVDPVLLGFQELMSQFLDTQRDVMLQYLGSHHVPHAPVEALPPAAHPTELADMSGPMPAAEPQPGPHQSTAGHGTALVPSQAPQNGAAPADSGETSAETALAAFGSVAESMEQLQGRLMEIVSERTGYPPEMLDLDLDLEADLGIDSIKRIEILGELAEGLGIDATDESTLELEKLTSERSLRGMLNYLEEALFSSDGRESGAAIVDQSQPSPDGSVPQAVTQEQPAIPPRTGALPKPQNEQLDAPTTDPDSLDTERIQRGRVRLVEAPLPSMSAPVIPSGAVIVTDDGRGVAVELADQLGDLGQAVHVIRMCADQEVTEVSGVIHADLTRPDHVDEVVAKVRAAAGPIAGLIHLLPLSLSDNGSWSDTARRDARSLYLLARATEEDLNERAASGSAIVLAATGLGGELGFSGNGCSSLQAGHGGVIGFVKCLAMEWPEVMVRAIDMNASQSVDGIVETLLSELRDPEGPLEVGSGDERRVTWEPFSAPLEASGAAKIDIDSSSVILLTGGARGITAAIAKELARRYQPTLILAGRSELIDESPETQPLATAAEIKKALIASLSTNGSVEMSKVEAAYNKLVRCREIRENIAAMEAAGSQVEYHAVDVRDETAVKRLIEHIVSSQGRLDGVVHGAGVIEDKLVKDKVPESFDRVFGTKVDSVAHLVKYLPQDKLKFMALFSSIASRFGNRGQSDYAAANEVLSKLAAELDRRWDARVFAVAWGPWSGTGMVSYLESHLTARGITLISPAEGADHLINEILYGSKGESEIMIAGGAAKLVTETASRAST